MKASIGKVRVLDLTRLLPGPYATHMLQAYGAEVIKVESPSMGDYARDINPLDNSGMGAAFTASNCGKRSIAIDLKEEAGKAVFRELARQADVVVESFRPGTMVRLGLAYEDLRRINPRMIYCAITGYGQQTDLAYQAGHDLNYQGLAGLLLNEDSGTPSMPSALLADLVGGAYSGTIAILAALLERQFTGEGRFIDLSITHSAMMLQPLLAARVLDGKSTPEQRHGGAHPAYRIYETQDRKYISLAALEQKFWDKFCHSAGCEWLAGPVELADEARVEAIAQHLEQLFKSRAQDDWVRLGKEWDVCLAPVLTTAEAIRRAQEERLPLFRSAERGGKRISVLSGIPADLQNPEAVASPPPLLGQHTREIAQELGMEQALVDELHAAGILMSPSSD